MVGKMIEMSNDRAFLRCVRHLKDMGYGRMMQIIATEWYRVGGISAFTLGPCVGNIESDAAKECDYWLKNDPIFQDTNR